MIETGLSLESFMNATEGIINTIWEIHLDDEKIYVWRDCAIPDIAGRTLDLRQTVLDLLEHNIYTPDQDLWRSALMPEGLRAFAEGREGRKKLEIRLIGEPYGFEWHEMYLTVLPEQNISGRRVLMYARRIESEMRSRLVESAVREDYDYVIYIDSHTKHFIRYLSSNHAKDPLPPEMGEDYEKELLQYNSTYIPEGEWEETTRQMSFDNVIARLEDTDEFILYCRTMHGKALRDKKLRFCYFDRDRKIILLTRTDITEIREEKRQKKLLEDALHAAQAANEAKSTFLSRMSHDIRTPMNAIIGLTAIAGTHVDNRMRVLDCLDKITGASKLLLGLINEVLDMSRIESGRILLSEEDFMLNALFKDIIAMIQPDLNRKGHKLNVHIENITHEAVTGDVQRIQQVLINLLTNAIKYTPSHGHITFEISQSPSNRPDYGLYRFICEDDGVGIQEEFLDRIFEPFERAEDESICEVQGTGLGMAISKNIVQMMNGSISVESTPGKGSRFTVTFCLKLQNQPALDAGALAELPVLVADDDLIVCEEACECLNKIGMKCSYVTTGSEAVREVILAHEAYRDYFAVIVDLRMPDLDGIEVVRRIRHTVGADVPIIVISAYDSTEYEIEAQSAGANGFISKPLFPSRLITMLRRFALDEPEDVCPAPTLPKASFFGRRVLLAEDNVLNQEIAVELLGNTGILVDTAINGREALERFLASQPGYYDLIFMDIQMPQMNGYEVTRAIRALSRSDAGTIPIVAMTANAFAEDVHQALECGMNQHLAKPLDMQQLMQVLSKWLIK